MGMLKHSELKNWRGVCAATFFQKFWACRDGDSSGRQTDPHTAANAFLFYEQFQTLCAHMLQALKWSTKWRLELGDLGGLPSLPGDKVPWQQCPMCVLCCVVPSVAALLAGLMTF